LGAITLRFSNFVITEMKNSIRIENLSRSFSARTVFQSAEIKTPEFGFLSLCGNNGSGKSTLLKILSTQLLPSSGEAWISGNSILKDPKSVQKVIGVAVASEMGFYPRLTGLENLILFSKMRENRNDLAKITELPIFPKNSLSTYFQDCSTGMKQALHLARALIAKPKVLLLDEISRSFDANYRNLYLQTIESISTSCFVISATHDPMEIEKSNHQWRIENEKLFAL
jgi:ABC-2 type transport system ATP-binding protein